jgi:CheY-like chemotaxis protein
VSYVNEQVRIEVADSGVGLPKDKIEQLFERFVQADASTTRRFGGAGLGLAICRQLADLMGGSITASSVEGKGSLFVGAPADGAGRRAGAVGGCGAAGARPDAAPIRILAAEDNQVNQLVLKTLLSQAGIEPTVVENGAEAVEAWRSGAWDVILMDIQMPVMDGVAATREIRACEVADHRLKTPIIAVTANAMPHQVKEYADAGMDLVVPKPLDAAHLFDAIERALTPEPAAGGQRGG